MADLGPVELKIDKDALKAQVSEAINEALIEASWKLRQAADALNPGWLYEQDLWIENEVARRVAEATDAV